MTQNLLAVLFFLTSQASALETSQADILNNAFDGQKIKVSPALVLPLQEKKPEGNNFSEKTLKHLEEFNFDGPALAFMRSMPVEIGFADDPRAPGSTVLYSQSTGEPQKIRLNISRQQWDDAAAELKSVSAETDEDRILFSFLPKLYADLEIARIKTQLKIPNSLTIDLLEETRVLHEAAFLRRLLAKQKIDSKWVLTPSEYDHIQNRIMANPVYLSKGFEAEPAAQAVIASQGPVLPMKNCLQENPKEPKLIQGQQTRRENLDEAQAFLQKENSLSWICAELHRERASAEAALKVQIPAATELDFTNRVLLNKKITQAAETIHLHSIGYAGYRLEALNKESKEINAYAKSKNIEINENHAYGMIRQSLFRTHLSKVITSIVNDGDGARWNAFINRTQVLIQDTDFRVTPAQKTAALRRIDSAFSDSFMDSKDLPYAWERLEALEKVALMLGGDKQETSMKAALAGIKMAGCMAESKDFKNAKELIEKAVDKMDRLKITPGLEEKAILEQVAKNYINYAVNFIETERRDFTERGELRNPMTTMARANAVDKFVEKMGLTKTLSKDMLMLYLKYEDLRLLASEETVNLSDIQKLPKTFAEESGLQELYRKEAKETFTPTLLEILNRDLNKFKRAIDDSAEKKVLNSIKLVSEAAEALRAKEVLMPAVVKCYTELAQINAEAGWTDDAFARLNEGQKIAEQYGIDFKGKREETHKSMIKFAAKKISAKVADFNERTDAKSETEAQESILRMEAWADKLGLRAEFAPVMMQARFDLVRGNIKAGWLNDAESRLTEAQKTAKDHGMDISVQTLELQAAITAKAYELLDLKINEFKNNPRSEWLEKQAKERIINAARWTEKFKFEDKFKDKKTKYYLQLADINIQAGFLNDAYERIKEARESASKNEELLKECRIAERLILDASFKRTAESVKNLPKSLTGRTEEKTLNEFKLTQDWMKILNFQQDYYGDKAVEIFLELSAINIKAGYLGDSIPRLEETVLFIKNNANLWADEGKEAKTKVAQAYMDLAKQYSVKGNTEAAKKCQKAAKDLGL